MIFYSLQNDISLNKLQKDVQKLVQQHLSSHKKSDSYLFIDIKTVDHNSTKHIPRIEHKNV